MRALRNLSGVLVFCGLLSALPAGAAMVLSDVVLDLRPDERWRDVEVWNSGSEVLYIQVEVSEVLDPAAPNEERRKLEDPRTAEILASPSRMALVPNERKILRVVVREPAVERDRIYRVSLIPKENPAESDERLAVKVLVGYELLLIVRPPNPDPGLRIERNGRELNFANTGNSSILILKLTQCEPEPAGCTDLPGNRLYAGEAWRVELPGDAPVQVFKTFGVENSIESY